MPAVVRVPRIGRARESESVGIRDWKGQQKVRVRVCVSFFLFSRETKRKKDYAGEGDKTLIR